MTTSSRRPTPASRPTRRSRRPAPRSSTFLERNRNRLLWLGAGAVFLILVGMAYVNATTPVYACQSGFDPTPSPAWVEPTAAPGTLAPGATPTTAPTPPPPGFVQPDQGHTHTSAVGDRVRYAQCPPASGKHWNTPGGPIDAKLYGPDEFQAPQGWVHNLEHGALVLVYKCPGAGCDAQGQAALAALRAKWPNSPVCNLPPDAQNPVFTRFDDMPWDYAALVWDVVLPMPTLNEDDLFAFYKAYGERFNQEKRCAAPTPTPGPTATPGPSVTAAPSTAPTAAPTTAPTAAPTTSPAAS